MSSLQKSFAKAKLSTFPPSFPSFPPEDEEEEEEGEDEENPSSSSYLFDTNNDDLPSITSSTDTPISEHVSSNSEHAPSNSEYDSSSASSTSSTGTIKPLEPSKHLFTGTNGSPSLPPLQKPPKNPLTPLPWPIFFTHELYLEHDTIIHHAYLTPPTASFPLFITHHGAGSSGLSFAACAAEILKACPGAGILSLDARGHGETRMRRRKELNSSDDDDVATEGGNDADEEEVLDWSLETLSEDLVRVVQMTQERMRWTELPDMVLVGHSLGGAVVTEVAAKGRLGEKVLGYAVLDVVEGSAMDALQSIHSYLSTRPRSFQSITAGIEWHTRTRTIRNSLSARASVPALLSPLPCPSNSTSPPPISPNSYTWRTNLAATQPFWQNWFVGLSVKFLSAKGGKLLLLAGTDRLDKELMIGQMQGKYQLQVFPDAGHFIHEDQPAKTAGVLVDFWRRNDRGVLVLPPKVGELLERRRQEGRT